MGYLIDSNVIIDYVAERFDAHELTRLDSIFDESFNISIITKIEILGFNNNAHDEAKLLNFINHSETLNLSDLIVNETIKLRKHIKIKTPDAIVAATALAFDMTLITNNISDFKRVNRLKLLNPYKI